MYVDWPINQKAYWLSTIYRCERNIFAKLTLAGNRAARDVMKQALKDCEKFYNSASLPRRFPLQDFCKDALEGCKHCLTVIGRRELPKECDVVYTGGAARIKEILTEHFRKIDAKKDVFRLSFEERGRDLLTVRIVRKKQVKTP